MKSRPLRHGNLKDEITNQIRQMVFTGELVPGAKIDQDALANDFGVSKLPIRESLIWLESEGLIINEPRRGWFVAEISPEDVLDHYRMLSYISGLLAGRAATKLDDASLDRLTAILDEMSPQGHRRREDLEELNFQFHWIINSASSSRRLRSTLKFFSEAIPAHFFELVHEWSDIAYEDHRRILDALRNRDVKAAEQAMTEHIVRGGVHAVGFLTERGFWARDAETVTTTA